MRRAAIERDFRPNTKLVFTESPGSLTFEVQDVPAIAEVAHRRGALVVLDNSWATPFGFRAFDHGVDVSVHAATKYIGGHSDVLLGLIVANETVSPTMQRLWTDMGVTASSDDCFLGLRGLRTLPLRLARHQASALAIAQWLRDASRSARSHLSARCRARAGTSCGSATSRRARDSSPWCSSRSAEGGASTRCSTA